MNHSYSHEFKIVMKPTPQTNIFWEKWWFSLDSQLLIRPHGSKSFHFVPLWDQLLKFNPTAIFKNPSLINSNEHSLYASCLIYSFHRHPPIGSRLRHHLISFIKTSSLWSGPEFKPHHFAPNLSFLPFSLVIYSSTFIFRSPHYTQQISAYIINIWGRSPFSPVFNQHGFNVPSET